MKPLVLCIIDGVGISPDTEHNAVKMAAMPFYNKLLEKYPNTQLDASGAAVGLPLGTMGNSEVGHITIGSGRIVNQFLRRFQIMVSENKLKTNPKLETFISSVKESGGIVHMIGMVSDGRVHSDIATQIDILRPILADGLSVCIDFIADGRDTLPRSAEKYINELKIAFVNEFASGQLFFGTLSGRYYAMDRNDNWDRTQAAFDAIADGKSEFIAGTIDDALAAAYNRDETDEFIKPTVIKKSPIRSIDGVLFTNYRSDRARQILRAIAVPEFSSIKRQHDYIPPHMLCFSQYGMGLDEYCPALLPDVTTENTLGDVLAANEKQQLRIAETEKYNHVTYFFDAERTIDYPGEEKILIASPNVATFDLKPEMSANEITDALLPKLDQFDVVILNYANGDMVGHTGNIPAAITAMETLDAQLSRLIPRVLELDGCVLITADHGNAEKMWDTGANGPWTAHTTNPVPFIVIANDTSDIKLADNGGLADIAPTMLKIMGIPQPDDMTGKSLIN